MMAKKKADAASPFVPPEEQPYQVPENWRWVRLASVIVLISGRDVALSLCNDKGNGIPYILGASNIADNKFIVERWIESPEVVSKKDDILISVKGTIGKLYIQKEEEINISRQIMAVRPQESVNCLFIYHFLEKICDELRNAGNGLIPGISRNDILNHVLPLPPLAEQQRIVERIESLFAKLDEAKEKAQEALESFETRKAAMLHKAFNGELTIGWRKEHSVLLQDWTHKQIADFAIVKGGKRIPKGHSLQTEPTHHPYLRIADFGRDTIDVSDLHYISDETFDMISRYIINHGDVYISIVGSIGKVGTVPKELDGASLTENAARIISKETHPEYLEKFLSSPKAQEDIKKRTKSATLGKLSLANINALLVPIPSLEEQKEIVRILDNFLDYEIEAEAKMESTLAAIDAIKKAILAKAFRGELGTNNPADGSAEELLRRTLA